MERRVVVTGMGAVTPIGNTVDDMWAAAHDGICGIAPIASYDTDGMKVTLAGEIKELNVTEYIDKREARKMARFTQLALIAANEAILNSGIACYLGDATRCGTIVSSGIGGLGTIEDEHDRGLENGFDRVSPHFIPMVITNMAAGTIAIAHGLKGPCMCVTTACAGGTNAVGEAYRVIRADEADAMVCGGAESCITPLGIGGFTSMRALSESTDPLRASIPFDLERNGFVMGEGAGMLVLEELEHARARGAIVYGEVVGYGTNCDAYHVTSPDITGDAAARCMWLALDDAGIETSAIDYINAHGTSTPMNDSCESTAIRSVFGSRTDTLPVSSTKSMTGHLLGAAGAIEAILCIKALECGFIPPNIGYRVPDEACALDIVANIGRSADLEYALSNSLGFGGHNATLVFKRWED